MYNEMPTNKKNIKDIFTDTEALEVIQQIKKQINFESLNKFRLFINQIKDKPKEYFKSNRLDITMKDIHMYIFKNLDEPNFYTLFNLYKSILIVYKQDELLQGLINLSPDKIQGCIQILDDNMSEIIQRQMKSKKSRKNIKARLRLQRKLNEMREKVAELTNTQIGELRNPDDKDDENEFN